MRLGSCQQPPKESSNDTTQNQSEITNARCQTYISYVRGVSEKQSHRMRIAVKMYCVKPGLSIIFPSSCIVLMKTADAGLGNVPNRSCIVQ